MGGREELMGVERKSKRKRKKRSWIKIAAHAFSMPWPFPPTVHRLHPLWRHDFATSTLPSYPHPSIPPLHFPSPPPPSPPSSSHPPKPTTPTQMPATPPLKNPQPSTPLELRPAIFIRQVLQQTCEISLERGTRAAKEGVVI